MSSLWTPKPQFRGRSALLKAFSQGTCGVLCALILSSCGQSMPAGYPGSPESSTQSDTLQPLTVPPNSEGPPAPGTTGAPKTADGLPALQVKGVNTQLFSKRMSDEADRLDRLENAVQELRNDFDAMAPAIVRLVSIEGDIQALIKQLEVLNGDAGAVSAEQIPVMEESTLNQSIPAQNIDAPLPPIGVPANADAQATPALSPLSAPPAQEYPMAHNGSSIYPEEEPPVPVQTRSTQSTAPAAPIPRNNAVTVMDIRVGEHPGKTRIVLDVAGKNPAFTADLDNNEKILVVELPSTGWATTAQKNLSGSSLLSLYRTEPAGANGTILILQLKKTSSIAYKAAVNNPDGSSKIIIDLTNAK